MGSIIQRYGELPLARAAGKVTILTTGAAVTQVGVTFPAAKVTILLTGSAVHTAGVTFPAAKVTLLLTGASVTQIGVTFPVGALVEFPKRIVGVGAFTAGARFPAGYVSFRPLCSFFICWRWRLELRQWDAGSRTLEVDDRNGV